MQNSAIFTNFYSFNECVQSLNSRTSNVRKTSAIKCGWLHFGTCQYLRNSSTVLSHMHGANEIYGGLWHHPPWKVKLGKNNVESYFFSHALLSQKWIHTIHNWAMSVILSVKNCFKHFSNVFFFKMEKVDAASYELFCR